MRQNSLSGRGLLRYRRRRASSAVKREYYRAMRRVFNTVENYNSRHNLIMTMLRIIKINSFWGNYMYVLRHIPGTTNYYRHLVIILYNSVIRVCVDFHTSTPLVTRLCKFTLHLVILLYCSGKIKWRHFTFLKDFLMNNLIRETFKLTIMLVLPSTSVYKKT